MVDDASYRLPRTVEPQLYELTLSPDLGTATFTGEQRVRVLVHEPVDRIVLNAVELDIISAEVTDDAGNQHEGKVRLDEIEQRATIELPSTINPGPWTLSLAFSGVLNDKLRGFYRSTYKDDDGNEHVIATTQFEATDARRAFPCWDEPDRKAVFAVTLIVDDGLTAISNGGVERRTDLGNGKVQVDFADTIRMSTYLVAFVVGPLVTTEPVDVDGVPLRVACVPGKEHLTPFALEVGAHSLRFFTAYFGLPYPGDKLDLIALPDFAMGAMENLGAVTFRETALLVDPHVASRIELQRVADVIAHEIAHMWFGDLVTMKWWNGLWLNEAFATFMEMLCVDAFRPDWKRWVSFGPERGRALVTDGLSSTRPIEFPVGRPEEAEGMFDVLTYEKGAGVLRMLEVFLGAERFQAGIGRYLSEHSYDNAETTDLWDALEAATGEPVRSTMDSWIFQGGYPVLTVTPAEDGRATLQQRRFHYREGMQAAGTRWSVPVVLRSVEGHRHERLLLTDDESTVDLPGGADGTLVNAGGWGFYRVHYPAPVLQRLAATRSHLEPLERFNLVSDAWAGVLAGMSPLGEFVSMLEHFPDEDDADVWTAIRDILALVDRIADNDGRRALQLFVRRLAGDAFGRVGWTAKADEDDRTGTLRATLVELLGVIGADPEVQERAQALHGEVLSRGAEVVDPNLLTPLTRVVSHVGGEREYTDFLERFRHPTTPQEELRYLSSLALFEHPGLLQRTLDLCLSEVRTQNAPFVLGTSLTNRAAGELAWEFIKANWGKLLARFPESSIPRMLEGVTSFTDEGRAADVHAFLDAHPLESGQKTVDQLRERLDINVAFARRERHGLTGLFG